MPRTEILFCRPVTPQALEDRMDLEAEAAEELGIDFHSVVLEDVVDGELERALDGLPRRGRRLLYRGWMLTEEEYAALHEALLERGHSLVVAPAEYAPAHYLPNYHPELEALAVPARWTFGTDLDEAWEAARALGEGPWILKDHVQSVKERWDTSSEVYEDVDVVKPDLSRFNTLSKHIDSPFFTADVAMLESGEWVVVEVGDGGVSTLPPLMDPRDFYRALRRTALWDEG